MFPSLSSLSQPPHPNAVDLTQNASMHNPAAAPQGQPNPTETNVAQFATANRQAAQNSEFEGSEGDSLTDIFFKIKSEFPTLPSLSDPNGNEAQYQLSSDDLGFEGRSLALNPPSLEFPNSLRTSSNLLLVPHMPSPPPHLPVPPFLPVASNLPTPASVDSFAILPNAQTQQTRRRKRKLTHHKDKVQELDLPSSSIENDTNHGRPAKKVKVTDNEESEKGDVNSQMDNLKKRINEFLEQENVSRVYFNFWLKDIIQLSQFDFTNNKNEYIKCIEHSFKSFLSGEIYRKRFTRSLFAYNSLKRINLLEEHILPILSSELKKDLSQLIQGEKLKHILGMRKRAAIKAAKEREGHAPNEILTNSKVDEEEDNEAPQEGNACFQTGNEEPQDDDWDSQMGILKQRIRKFLEQKAVNCELFKTWVEYTIQLSQYEFKDNKNEYIECINDSFRSFLSVERYRKKLSTLSSLFYRNNTKINQIEKYIFPLLSPELKQDLNEFLQPLKLKGIDFLAKIKRTDNEEPQEGEGYSQNEILTKNKVDDEDYEDESFNSQTIKVKANIIGITKKALGILKNRFPMKPEFKNIISKISKKFDNTEFSSEIEKEKYIDCINRIFKEFLSDRWKARFISALSMHYTQAKVDFLKEKIVPLLLPETAKILQEVADTYKPGGTTHLCTALNKFNKSVNPKSIKAFKKFTQDKSVNLLTDLLGIVVQYAKNQFGRSDIVNTSSYLTDISNIFATLDDEKIQLLNVVLPKFSLEDLNILAEWIPEIKKPIDDEIARRAPQVP